VLRGWANYHRYIICGETFARIDSYVWFRLFRWGKRRHPGKSGQWVAKRYFSHHHDRAWCFKDKATGKSLIQVAQAVPSQRYTKIVGDANPFDPEWQSYFRDREQSLKIKTVNNYIGKVLKQQQGACPHCQQRIQAEDKHHLHYRDGDKTHKRIKNVLILHKTCRQSFEYQRDSNATGASIDRDVSHA